MPKVRISVAEWVPWIQFDANKTIASAKGVLVELYKGIKQLKVFDYELLMAKLYGTLGPDKKWTGMVGRMLSNDTDIAGPFFMGESRGRVIRFATPLDFSQLVITTGLTSANKDPFLIFRVFTVKVWLTLISTVFVVAGTACFIYSVSGSSRKKSNFHAFLKYIWVFGTSLLGKEFGANSRWFLRYIWDTPSFRFVQSVWLMTCIVFVYTYQGSIISSYAANKMIPKYNNLDDLMADTTVEIGTYASTYPALCMSKLTNTSLEPLWLRAQKNLQYAVVGLPEWMDSVEEGKIVIVGEMSNVKYLIGERFKVTGKCGIRAVPLDFCASYLALASRKELSKALIKKFNIGIQKFNEGGMSKRQKSESLLFYDICTQSVTNVAHPLDLVDLIGAFVVLGTGLVLSSLYLALEILSNRKYGVKSE